MCFWGWVSTQSRRFYELPLTAMTFVTVPDVTCRLQQIGSLLCVCVIEQECVNIKWDPSSCKNCSHLWACKVTQLKCSMSVWYCGAGLSSWMLKCMKLFGEIKWDGKVHSSCLISTPIVDRLTKSWARSRSSSVAILSLITACWRLSWATARSTDRILDTSSWTWDWASDWAWAAARAFSASSLWSINILYD